VSVLLLSENVGLTDPFDRAVSFLDLPAAHNQPEKPRMSEHKISVAARPYSNAKAAWKPSARLHRPARALTTRDAELDQLTFTCMHSRAKTLPQGAYRRAFASETRALHSLRFAPCDSLQKVQP